MELGSVRQQRDHVYRGERDPEAQVLEPLLAPRRERADPCRQAARKAGRPRSQTPREPGSPRRERLHGPIVRPGAAPGDRPQG